MNGTEITVKGDAVRGRMIIRQDDLDDELYTVECRNFVPVQIRATDLVQAFAAALASIPSMKRTVEFRTRRKLAAEQAEVTRMKNGTSLARGRGAKGKAKKTAQQAINESFTPEPANTN